MNNSEVFWNQVFLSKNDNSRERIYEVTDLDSLEIDLGSVAYSELCQTSKMGLLQK